MKEVAPFPIRNYYIPILVGALVLVLIIIVTVTILVHRHKQRYNVDEAWKARQEDSDATEEDQVTFTKTTGGVELSAFANEKDATHEFDTNKSNYLNDMEQNPAITDASVLVNKDAMC